MNIDDVLERINAGNLQRAGSYFEIFVQHLLGRHFDKRGKNYFPEYRIDRHILDGYVTESFDGIEGPVGFEIKYLKQPNASIINGLLYHANSLIKERKLGSVIVVMPFVPGLMRRMFLLKESSQIIIWSKDKLNDLIQEDEAYASQIVRNLFKLDLENEIRNRGENWMDSRKKILDSIKEVYQRGNISLILGAGVSCSAGLPDWKKLLNSLYANFVNRIFKGENFAGETLNAITNLFTTLNNSSALATARYLKTGLSHDGGNDTEFIQAVKEALYDNVKCEDSKLIDEIVELCRPKSNGIKVKSIVTYNFDDLIERHLESADIRHRTIYDENELHDIDELPVYHVHGYISRNNSLESGHLLVFSEETYHNVYSEPYHWSNLVQLSTFRENNCLMIGLSMSDPNLRRLLEISAQKYSHEKRHYVFMQRFTMNTWVKDERLHDFDLASVDKILEIHHTIQEMMMESLGIYVIWYSDYDEIPLLLKQVRGNE